MKSNAKSSITLPPNELKLVEELMKRIGAKSKVEVIRRGLLQLKETTDRELLRLAYSKASAQSRDTIRMEIEELDSLSGEGIDR